MQGRGSRQGGRRRGGRRAPLGQGLGELCSDAELVPERAKENMKCKTDGLRMEEPVLKQVFTQ